MLLDFIQALRLLSVTSEVGLWMLLMDLSVAVNLESVHHTQYTIC